MTRRAYFLVLLLIAAIMVAVAAFYFSPVERCVRAREAAWHTDDAVARQSCTAHSGNSN